MKNVANKLTIISCDMTDAYADHTWHIVQSNKDLRLLFWLDFWVNDCIKKKIEDGERSQ
jgi:hypothetical protein